MAHVLSSVTSAAVGLAGRTLSEGADASAAVVKTYSTHVPNPEMIEVFTRLSDTVLVAVFVLPALSLLYTTITDYIAQYNSASSSDAGSTTSGSGGCAPAVASTAAMVDVQKDIDEEKAIKGLAN